MGEIFFCHDVIADAAREDDVTGDHEMIYVFFSWVLHLLGYDHSDEILAIQDAVTATILAKQSKNIDKKIMRRLLRSLTHAGKGILFTLRNERNFQVEITVALLVLLFMVWLPITSLEQLVAHFGNRLGLVFGAGQCRRGTSNGYLEAARAPVCESGERCDGWSGVRSFFGCSYPGTSDFSSLPDSVGFFKHVYKVSSLLFCSKKYFGV